MSVGYEIKVRYEINNSAPIDVLNNKVLNKVVIIAT
ncbi:hypothetical protein N476_06265 [Pseudoalteromonas luteoviolacea H33]|uniref:Uncharacterized protein n=1 Tax=Pseudoalteromonas luteoviolacea H33 TaxID=1365251 RepID=A0A166ZS14_9GAMM|nr:hypothetical protein N476_06265 [Pseudoalteromonas luteoviolacea H33]KZN75403.1 hypothetical protein N477_19275 [Pseudoalteromonas luteoviolacea H33-S]